MVIVKNELNIIYEEDVKLNLDRQSESVAPLNHKNCLRGYKKAILKSLLALE